MGTRKPNTVNYRQLSPRFQVLDYRLFPSNKYFSWFLARFLYSSNIQFLLQLQLLFLHEHFLHDRHYCYTFIFMYCCRFLHESDHRNPFCRNNLFNQGFVYQFIPLLNLFGNPYRTCDFFCLPTVTFSSRTGIIFSFSIFKLWSELISYFLFTMHLPDLMYLPMNALFSSRKFQWMLKNRDIRRHMHCEALWIWFSWRDWVSDEKYRQETKIEISTSVE